MLNPKQFILTKFHARRRAPTRSSPDHLSCDARGALVGDQIDIGIAKA